LDALGERLKEPRIRRVVQAIITGETDVSINREDPDVMLAMDLGLVRWDIDGGFTIANPIYEEILTRKLNLGYHDNMPSPSSWQWQKADGSIDMDKMLKEFQNFWRRHADRWEEKAEYTEAFPHLLLLAFLQRVLNGGGSIERECAAGSGRMDLCIEYSEHRYIIEVKLTRDYDSPETVKEEGLEQIGKYRDRFPPGVPAWLIIFDRRSKTRQQPWEQRITWETDGDVAVLGC
jgi:hypothetical protein